MIRTKTLRTLISVSCICLFGLFACVSQIKLYQPPHESMITGSNGWQALPLLTVGQPLPTNDFRFAPGPYRPTGLMDGLGGFQMSSQTVRLFINHELSRTTGYSYRLRNGTLLTGARISFIDVDRASRRIRNSGIAYHTVRNRQGKVVTRTAQINEEKRVPDGFSRFCSAHLVRKGTYGFQDTIFFTHEEIQDPLAHPFGGSLWALDVENQVLHAIPSTGRMAWENTAPLTTHRDQVALLIGDDSQPQTDEPGKFGQKATSSTPINHVVTAPLWLYIGMKNASPLQITHALPEQSKLSHNAFLNRNGLLVGELYYFVADSGVTSIAQFNGTGSSIHGIWQKIDVFDPNRAGETGFDALGYKNGFTLRQEAKAGGAFQFSRPEDVSTHPTIGTRATFASTGRDTVFGSLDEWGTIYQVDVDVMNLSSTIRILYDGDDAGGQFEHPDFGIRSPDNLHWSQDGFIYIQEDNSKAAPPLFGSRSREESSIWQLNPETGTVQRIAQLNRSVVLPVGTTDRRPDTLGAWESSGVLDVTHLFKTQAGERLLLATVQAHSIRDGIIQEDNLGEGGQLVFLKKRFVRKSTD